MTRPASMRAKFFESWSLHCLPGQPTLLLSGGGDSVALFWLLTELEIVFDCLHFTHDGAPDFVADSEGFCRNLCESQGVDLELRPVCGRALMQEGDLSWEAACRTLRYRYLQDLGEGPFLTAHTADDQAETLLLRLLSGSGLAGLSGIRRARADGVFRPLLDFRRAELRAYLKGAGHSWLEDPSNVDGNRRAQLRHQVMPFLEEFEPSLVASMSRSAEILADDEEGLTQLALDWLQESTQPDHWPVDALWALTKAVRYRVFRELWRRVSRTGRRPLGSVFCSLENLLEKGGDNRAVFITDEWKLRRLGGNVWLEPVLEPVWNELALNVDQQVGEFLSAEESGEGVEVPRQWQGKHLSLRPRKAGDRCQGKDLKKLLSSTGQPPWVRDRWPLVTNGSEILWALSIGSPPWSSEPTVGESVKVLFRPDRLRWPGGADCLPKPLK